MGQRISPKKNKKYLETNENGHITYQIHKMQQKNALRGKYLAIMTPTKNCQN